MTENNKRSDSVKKRINGINTRNLILVRSAELFSAAGYDSVSVREIAKAVGIKESSIYNHFSNKKEILEVLFEEFGKRAPESRPSQEQLEEMADVMNLKEILKNILFRVGRNIDLVLFHTSIIIQSERFRDPLAAQTYRKYILEEPIEYYKKLIEIMIKKNKITNRNAMEIIRQYAYAANSASQEYFIAKNGLGDPDQAVLFMLETIDFYCSLLDKEAQLRVWR